MPYLSQSLFKFLTDLIKTLYIILVIIDYRFVSVAEEFLKNHITTIFYDDDFI